MLLSLAFFLIVSLGAAALATLAATPALAMWYGDLRRPTWTPPAAAYPIMTVALHALMGLAGWLAWQSCGWVGAVVPLALFGTQLLLHVLWSVAFFGMRRPDLATADAVLLWIALRATIDAFARCNVLAAWMLWPVLGWVTWLALSSFAIWRSNREP